MKNLLSLLLAIAALSMADFAAAQNAVVNVVHGIDGRDVGLPRTANVDVLVNGNVAFANLQFGQIRTASLPAGNYRFRINRAGTNTLIYQTPGPVAILAGRNYSAVAHLTAAGAPTITPFLNRLGQPNSGTAVTLHHTAAAPGVDIYQNFGPFFFRAFTNVRNGQRGTTLAINNPFVVWVTATGSVTPVLGPAPLTLDPNRVTNLFVVGRITSTSNTLSIIRQDLTP